MLDQNTAKQPSIDRVGSVLRGKWTLDRQMGRGRLSTFYAATYRTGQRVALELLEPPWSRDPTLSAGFLRESYVANRLQHPGVVRVLDDGVTEDGAVFVVTDLLEGETLDARIMRVGRLPRGDAFDLGDRLLDVVAAGHEAGVVHGELTTTNVFLTTHGELRVLGYGVARFFASRFPEWSAGIWTPPEARATPPADLDMRSDLWGLGACLYKMLTSQFEPQANGQVRALRELALDVSIETGEVVDRALQRAPQERWQATRQMQQGWRVAWAESEDAAMTREHTAVDDSGPDSDPATETRQSQQREVDAESPRDTDFGLSSTLDSGVRPELPSRSPSGALSPGRMIASAGNPVSSPRKAPSSPRKPAIPSTRLPASSAQFLPLRQPLAHSPSTPPPLVPMQLAPTPGSIPPSPPSLPPRPSRPSSLETYTPPGVTPVPPRLVLLLVLTSFVLLFTGAALAVLAMRIFHYVPGMPR